MQEGVRARRNDGTFKTSQCLFMSFNCTDGTAQDLERCAGKRKATGSKGSKAKNPRTAEQVKVTAWLQHHEENYSLTEEKCKGTTFSQWKKAHNEVKTFVACGVQLHGNLEQEFTGWTSCPWRKLHSATYYYSVNGLCAPFIIIPR